MRRGEIWWAAFGDPIGSEPGYGRPAIIVSSNTINASALKTVLTVPVTGNLSREHFDTSVRLPRRGTGLAAASVAIVNQVGVTNKRVLVERIGRVPDALMDDIDLRLRLVLAL